MPHLAHILITDDDRRLRELLRSYLSEQGYHITEAADAAEARELLSLFTFDLMILDVMMPGETGLELARSLPTRKIQPPPILMLTARGEADDRIAGLESGVEDYLTKPFDPRELLLRISNILKRSQPEPTTLSFGPYHFDPATHRLRCGEELVHLTTTEATLLAALATQIGQAVSREELALALSDAESQEEVSSRKVDVQIGRLRKKIEQDTNRPRHIQTIRGAGYRLMV